MWDRNSIHLRIETGYPYREDMNDKFIEIFNTGNFNKGKAIFNIKNYNPKSLIVQHLPVKEKVNKIEIKGIPNSCIVDTLTSNDIQGIVSIGGKVIEFYAGVIFKENFKVSPSGIVIDK